MKYLKYDFTNNPYGTWIYFSDSGDVNEEGDEIWIEDVAYGIGETGIVLYHKPTNVLSNYAAVTIVDMDKKTLLTIKYPLCKDKLCNLWRKVNQCSIWFCRICKL